MAVTDAGFSDTRSQTLYRQSLSIAIYRMLAWVIVAVMFMFLVSNYLNFWLGWPGAVSALTYSGLLDSAGSELSAEAVSKAMLQAGGYALAIILPIIYVLTSGSTTLRRDAGRLSEISSYVIAAAFWAVLLVGFADMVISFLRVEDFLANFVGTQTALDLELPRFRGTVVHLPLIGIALIIALFSRGVSFAWLALLVVVAEFLIVITRFIFSYEQAFMGDLVRFWYAALFLFASAHTLLAEGHVRVDVLYSNFSQRTRGFVNAFGSMFLGITLCWIILLVGLWGKSNIINSPLLTVEVTQQGFGMYVKYLMAGFLAVYAVSMLIQFAASFLDSIADIRGDPGAKESEADNLH